MIKTILKLAVIWLMPLTAMAAEYEAGTHYKVLDRPIKSNSEAIIVNEFFGYSCPHCNAFVPALHRWSEQQSNSVRLVEVPVTFGRSWENYAKAYYISLQLGILEQTHDAMYKAVHENGRRILTKKALRKFFAEHGVSEADFENAHSSFDLQNKLRQGKNLTVRAKITSVPSMLVNGKYMVDINMAGSPEGMLAVVDYLVAQEQAK